jgi:hypothetical protein
MRRRRKRERERDRKVVQGVSLGWVGLD